ncbi:MAG: hypothetical protein ACI358_01405 [Candidatus Limimorpha sp.]
MGIIGSIIGGALSAGGAIFGGIKASQAMKEAKNNVEQQRRKNEDWYNRRYNEDATQRADAQRILTQTEENLKNRNRAAAGSAAVMGGTDESVAAAKAANSKAIADATSQIAANADARKDSIEATYLQNDNAYNEQLAAIEQQRAQSIAGAVQGVANAGADIAGAF